MTVTYPKHDKKEDEEEEEGSGGQIDDGRGEANGNVTEVRHGDCGDQRVIKFTRISLNLSVRSGEARYYLDGADIVSDYPLWQRKQTQFCVFARVL